MASVQNNITSKEAAVKNNAAKEQAVRDSLAKRLNQLEQEIRADLVAISGTRGLDEHNELLYRLNDLHYATLNVLDDLNDYKYD